MKSWPVEKPKTGGKQVEPECRNQENPPELKGSFDQEIINKILYKGEKKEAA